MANPISQISIEEICKQIHGSLGNSSLLVQVFACQLTPHECQRTREKYMEMYGEDLFDRLQNKIYGHTSRACTILSLLMLNPHERDAIVAQKAIFKDKDGVNYKALIEIYVGKKSSHFFLIQQAYQSKFRRHLDQDIMSIEPPHSYQKILMALSASQKAHSTDVSVHIGKCDAQRLFQTGEARCGGFKIDEGVVLEILSKRSIPQLKFTLSIYKHIYGHSYTKHLKNEYGGEFEDALKFVVKFLNNPPKYHAKALEAIIKGRTKDEGNLERIIVSQSENDINKIRIYYKNMYGMDLKDAILESFPLGDFRDLLLAFTMKSNIDS
ncbi:putative Annexin superfamily [Helianthus annuus]|nr:putative Annexin superfamily [Helianthus annuus]KAJ0848779.1 putative Annexin superfamily [Helianthus annuus]KAJ0857776.1 putative Annexin superfamily [Helianthus annuus]